MSPGLDRRRFLERLSGATAGLTLAGAARVLEAAAAGPAPPLAPARRAERQSLRLGFIGVGGRGRMLLRQFLEAPRVEVLALCDVDQLQLRQAVAITGRGPSLEGNHRRVLARDDIDAVVIATPDHWHAIQTIEACRAGKDVYVEKPLALCVAEGRRMVRAARRYGRVVQMGAQQRSGAHYAEARRRVLEGRLGKVTMVRAWNFRNAGNGRGRPPDAEPPATLDWNLWLGPRPRVPYNPLKAGPGFRMFWDYAGGVLTDWGTHHFDSIHHVMDASAPLEVCAVGGRHALDDMTDVPDTLSVLYQYDGWTLEYSNRETNGRAPYDSEYGLEFLGTRAAMYLDRAGFSLYDETDRTRPAEVIGTPGKDNFIPPELDRVHVADFLEAVRQRRLPAGDVEISHRSTTVAHLGNIAYLTRRRLRWDAARERFIGDPAADRLLRRNYRRPWRLPLV